jgi:choline dehydrogenase-like flavoprotein
MSRARHNAESSPHRAPRVQRGAFDTRGLPRSAATVFDTVCRVYRVAGLRVADASAMPTVTSGNTNAPVMLVAEHAALLILG